MSNICTNIQQSEILVRLGLDPATSDMWWIDDQLVAKSDKFDVPSNDEETTVHCAWSLSALLEMMPRNPCITYHLFSSMMPHEKDVNTTNGWVCDRTEFIKVDEGTFHEGTKRSYECFKGEDPLTAAYEMVCWLLTNNLITNN